MDYIVKTLLTNVSRYRQSNHQPEGSGLRIYCYVSDLEKREKTLLLYEEEGKLSKVRFKLIYRFSKGLSVHRAGLHSGAEADRSGTMIVSYL